MSDNLDAAASPAQRIIETRICFHDGCLATAGFGYEKPKGGQRWYCFEHRDDGERYLRGEGTESSAAN
jgi:hypothetical protein